MNAHQHAALGDTAWRTSTRTNGQNTCVQIRRIPDLVGIRDSKDPDTDPGTALAVTPAAFDTFLTGATTGRLRTP